MDGVCNLGVQAVCLNWYYRRIVQAMLVNTAVWAGMKKCALKFLYCSGSVEWML